MTRPKHSRIRRLVRNIGLFVISLLALIIVLEVVLRATHLFNARISWREPDPLLGWRTTPNSSYWYLKENDHPVTGRNNSFGWRDVERTLHKPGDTYRIAMLGDSFVEGLEVELDSTFLAIAEKRLNAQSDRAFEVMNFGRIGMTQSEELLVLQNEVVRFSPDMVALLFWPENDIRDIDRRTAINQLRPFYIVSQSGELILDTSFTQRREYKLKAVLSPFKKRSVLLSFLLERYGYLRWRMREAQVSPPEPAQAELAGSLSLQTAHPDPVYAENYRLNKRLIREMAEFCKQRGVRFLLICAGAVYKPEDEERRREVDPTFEADFFDTDLRAHADSLRIEFLGLHQPFERHYRATKRSLSWAHWNYEGHRVVADELVNKIEILLPELFDH
jgi:hypothetical protein